MFRIWNEQLQTLQINYRVVQQVVEAAHHFNGVESLHHLAKLPGGLAAGIVPMGGKEIEDHVAPVVALLRIELMDRKQLHNRYSKVLEIWDFLHESANVPRFSGLTPELVLAVKPLT